MTFDYLFTCHIVIKLVNITYRGIRREKYLHSSSIRTFNQITFLQVVQYVFFLVQDVKSGFFVLVVVVNNAKHSFDFFTL